MGSSPSSPDASAFLTLSDQIVPSGPAHADEQLIIVMERAEAVAEVAKIVPPGTVLVSNEEHPPLDRAARSGIESIAMPDTLVALRELLRSKQADVLLLADHELVTPDALKALRSGLAADSACATVSVDRTSSPRLPGVPPPGVVLPRPGAVLVRRDHLILALDETDLVDAGLASKESSANDGFLSRVLAALSRPGFVHRVVAPNAEAPSFSTASGVPVHRHFDADVVLDGRCLSYPLTGTQVHLLGLAGGLARACARVVVMQASELHPSLKSAVARLEKEIPFVGRSRIRRPAIFHRPFQVWSLEDLADCLSMGQRLVLTHQDMILDRTPAYTSTIEGWHNYRETTRAALSSADEIGFFSRHAAADAASDGLLELDRVAVIPVGVDHLSSTDDGKVADPFRGRPYLLVLGNTYWHKNRVFAIRLLRWLVDQEGWDGGLVLAGGDTGLGSSVVAEQALLHSTPLIRSRVADLGGVSELDRAALYRGAELVLFPSMYEGFGLIPFEAAAYGKASVYTHRASMREFLPEAGALPSFDVEEAGARVSTLLRDRSARERILAEVKKAAAGLTWDRTAAGYLEIYARALAREPRNVSRMLVGIDPSVSERETLLLDVYRRRRSFRLAADGLFRAVRVVRGSPPRKIRNRPDPH